MDGELECWLALPTVGRALFIMSLPTKTPKWEWSDLKIRNMGFLQLISILPMLFFCRGGNHDEIQDLLLHQCQFLVRGYWKYH
jgi:hypothetical protein